MTAEDELPLPRVPAARPNDPEDVSWALSTAEAMWVRGEHLEGIKWVRKAAAAASEVEDDERALELAKAASELASVVARRSLASVGEGTGLAGSAPSERSAASLALSGAPVSALPNTTRSHAPPAPSSAPSAAGAPGGVSPVRATPPRSAPPLPRPAQASGPPRSAPPAAAGPAASNPTGRAPPLPPARSEARQGPLPGRGILSNRASEKLKARRRSRENLEPEATKAGAGETAPHTAIDDVASARALSMPAEKAAGSVSVEISVEAPSGPLSGPRPEETVGGRVEPLPENGESPEPREKSTEEWDASPTQNLTGNGADHRLLRDEDGDRMTAFALPAAPSAPPPLPPLRGSQVPVHDPGIQTTQAVRVVVWRDANGVHVAPAGTVVSAIKIDAVLVVLEQGADLTAWLSQRER